MRHPDALQKVMALFKKIPGVGLKTAERYAFALLEWPPERVEAFAHQLLEMQKSIRYCEECQAFLERGECPICSSPSRQQNLLCVISTIKELFALEKTRSYVGHYHILGGLFSPIDGKFPQESRIDKLKERLASGKYKEVILAFDSTLEGDATALFLKKELASYPLSLTRLALGIPMGMSLEYIDEGTLARALHRRETLTI